MKCLVQFSGGKDSTASLIWAVKESGFKKENIKAVFCDTVFENSKTYQYILETVKILDIELIIVKSNKYKGFLDLAYQKKRFPSAKAKFCTEELKANPFIDYLLDTVKEHTLIVQGIRGDESVSRSKMNMNCQYFKYYFEPLNLEEINKNKNNLGLFEKTKEIKPKFHTYRKEDILLWKKLYSDDIIRPFFYKSDKETIDYILSNGFKLNPLYYEGFSRVGCFPCIMATKKEIKLIINNYPEYIEKLLNFERENNRSFFPSDFIPVRFCSKSAINRKGILVSYPSVLDVVNYISDDKNQLIESEILSPIKSCMSVYNICE
jgi:3'-phosphoadenosine 5'-phosphosulfate sulfotransferase (PAPS reductase)/FAD synthetase